MDRLRIALIVGVALCAGAGAVLACDQDIFCPDTWVWSDSEGTCVKAPTETM